VGDTHGEGVYLTNLTKQQKLELCRYLVAKNNPPPKSFESLILEKEGTWWVAKVKPHQEKAFAFDLLKRGVDYCLPCYEKKALRSDGKFRKSILVLFPSYVPFISEKPYDFLKLGRIATILPIKAQERFKKELHYLFLANASGTPIEPVLKTEQFLRGEPVEIIAGPLSGATGVVVDIKNDKRAVVLSIDGLGCAKIIINVREIKPKNLL
jgi:hypothetical protein